MGWQDDSTPVLPTATPTPSQGASADPFWKQALGYSTEAGQKAQAAQEASYPGSTKALWDKPADMPWGDFIGAHFGPAADVGRVAAGQVPFLGNAFDEAGAQARLKGTPYTGAGEALGMAGTGAGAEAAGAGRAIAGAAEPYIGKAMSPGVAAFLANRLGGAAEQGAIGAAGAAGQGGSAGDVAKAFGVGGATGAVLGPGGRGVPNTPSTDALRQTEKAAWNTAENTPVDPQAIANALGWTKRGLTPGEQALMSGGLGSAVNKAGSAALKAPSMSVDDVSKFQDAMWNAARNEVGAIRSTADQRLAAKFSGALEGALGPSASSVLRDANQATNVSKTGSEIDDWLANPNTAPKAIQGALAKDPDLYQTQPGLLERLTAIGQKASPDRTVSQEVASALAKRAGGAILGGGASYLVGGGLPGNLAGVAVGAALPSAGTQWRANQIRNSLLAAKHLNATGVTLPSSAFAQPGQISDALRQAGYGMGASGRY
jgi:hypothetical protein